jgi:hypothetical protein
VRGRSRLRCAAAERISRSRVRARKTDAAPQKTVAALLLHSGQKNSATVSIADDLRRTETGMAV